MSVIREIVYPFFFECCEFTPDNFWSNVFEELAYGKPPYGVYIQNGCMCCNFKDRSFSYRIQRKEPSTLFQEVYHLLNHRFGLLSTREKNRKIAKFKTIEQEASSVKKNWKDIRKKNIKDILIENYVISMKNKYNLSIKKAQMLLSLVTLALLFKVITARDVEYEEGKIISIRGIEFESGGERGGEGFDSGGDICSDSGEVGSDSGEVYILKNIYTPVPLIVETRGKESMSECWSKYYASLQEMKYR